MTSRVVRGGAEHRGNLKAIIISCDHMSCAKSVNDTAIKEGGGLKQMGWELTHGDGVAKHYCPEHRRTKESTN